MRTSGLIPHVPSLWGIAGTARPIWLPYRYFFWRWRFIAAGVRVSLWVSWAASAQTESRRERGRGVGGVRDPRCSRAVHPRCRAPQGAPHRSTLRSRDFFMRGQLTGSLAIALDATTLIGVNGSAVVVVADKPLAAAWWYGPILVTGATLDIVAGAEALVNRSRGRGKSWQRRGGGRWRCGGAHELHEKQAGGQGRGEPHLLRCSDAVVVGPNGW